MTQRQSGESTHIDPEAFRHVVGHLASGVTVITTETDGRRHGMTASSVTSLSMNPPMMLVCVNNAAPTAAAITEAGHFAVNVLSQVQGSLASQFGSPSGDKFRGVPLATGQLGAPVLSEALAHLECLVTEKVVGGTHTVFFGEVVAASAGEGEPLTYYRGGFGRFEFARDDEVYRAARRLILERAYPPGEVVRLEVLGQELGVDHAAAFYALSRLATDRLVNRDPQRGYVVTPFDVRTSDETFEARLLIELGVLEKVTGKVTNSDKRKLRRLFDVMAGLLIDEHFVDFDAYLAANYDFHGAIVDLADNALLSATYGSLAIKTVMTRSFGSTPKTSQRFISAQRRLLEAIENDDKVASVIAATSYCDLAKGRVREILAATQGVL